MVVNKITFADIAGVGRASVTLSVQRGKLVETKDGLIDTDHPVNKIYLDSRQKKTGGPEARKPRKQKPKKKEKPVTTTALPALEELDGVELPEMTEDEIEDAIKGATDGLSFDDDKGDDGGKVIDQLAKISVEVRLKLAQAKRHELKFEQDRGNLIPVESVERARAKLGAELKIRFQDMPRRLAPRLLAMAASGSTEQDIRDFLDREIDDGLEAVSRTLEAGPSV